MVIVDEMMVDFKGRQKLKRVQIDDKTQKCEYAGCSCHTSFICSKYQVVFCIVESKCFLKFHRLRR